MRRAARRHCRGRSARQPTISASTPTRPTSLASAPSAMLGSNRDYLEQLARQLAMLGIDDPYVAQLQQRVRALAGVHSLEGLALK